MNNFQQFCYKPWSWIYWTLILGVTTFLATSQLILFVLNWLFFSKNSCKKMSWLDSSADDTTNLIITNDKNKNKNKTRTPQVKTSSFHSAKSAGCSVKTTSGSSEAQPVSNAATIIVQTVDPPPILDLSLPTTSILNFVINLLLYLPCLVHMKPVSQLPEFELTDSFLLWCHVLLLIGGAVSPVLHLMSDEALSSLGLDLIRSKQCPTNLAFFGRKKEGSKSASEGLRGFENEAFDEAL
jgi:hypothetical protein